MVAAGLGGATMAESAEQGDKGDITGNVPRDTLI